MDYMKRIVICMLLLVSAACLFAAIGDVVLANVGFNGSVGPVGKDESHRSKVTIEGLAGSSYKIETLGQQSNNWIGEVRLSGDGTIEFKDCDITGPITITGNVAVTFTNCRLQSEVNCSGHTAGNLTFSNTRIASIRVGGSHAIEIKTASTLYGDVTALDGFSGSFSMLDSNFQNSPVLDFNWRPVTQFSVVRTAGDIGEIKLANAGLTSFALQQDSGTMGKLDLSGNDNASVRSQITARKNTWAVTDLNISGCGFTGAFEIDNTDIVKLDLSGNTGITSLTVNSGHRGSNNLKDLNASDCAITSADINMITDSANPQSVLNLAGNRLSLNHANERYEIGTTSGNTSDSRPSSTSGSDQGVVYYTRTVTSEDHEAPEWDEEAGEYVGGGTTYTYDECSYMYFNVGRNLRINGNRITTYFWGGRDWTSDTIDGILTGKNGNTPNWPSGRISGSSQTVTFDFSAEWSSLLALDVNLQNNGIEYTAGFKTSSSKWDTWIKFKVRTGELASDLHIGSMTPSSGGSNSQDYDAYIAIDGTAAANQLWDLPDTGGDGEKYFKLAASGTRFTTAISPDPGTGWNMNTQTIYSLHEHTFIIHRWKSYGGIGANTLRGLDMYIHPFGDSSIPAH